MIQTRRETRAAAGTKPTAAPAARATSAGSLEESPKDGSDTSLPEEPCAFAAARAAACASKELNRVQWT